MTELTLIRHAPTSHNIEGLFMGDLDIPIGPEGVAAAQELGRSLRNHYFTDYYSSPLARARETARHIFPDQTIIIDGNLKERGLGLWAGQSKQKIRKLYPAAFLPTGPMDLRFNPPQGEPYDDFICRTASFLERMVSMGPRHHVVAVTHNGVIRTLRCLLELRPIEEVFAEWEPVLQPRTYNIDGLALRHTQEFVDQVLLVKNHAASKYDSQLEEP